MTGEEARRITTSELREIVRDGDELAKGTKLFDEGGLQHLARHGNRIFAEAKGSGAAPYRVTITLEDAAVRSRCTCMAARSRPVCKHGAALVIAWARAAESFAVSDAPPAGADAGGPAKKKSVKAGKAQTAELMARGVEQVMALVRELGIPGVASATAARIEQLRSLAEHLRENRLRRLSARALDLADMIEAAGAQRVSALPYADLVADLLLTARKLEKHLAGEALEDRYVEELVGKTWRAADRQPMPDVELVEYAFGSRVTSDNFTIRESRFIELRSGVHYSEKQILPAFLAKRTEPKASYAGHVLRDAKGGAYPGFAPFRLDLEPPAPEPLTPDDLARLKDAALPDTGAALKAFQEHRRDVFAPDRMPVALRASMVVASGSRLSVADDGGSALFLPAGSALPDFLGSAALVALLGDVDVEGALPVLHPLAALIDGAAGLELRSVAEDALPTAGVPEHWSAVARAAGASAGAVSLGEVREELANALVAGLAGLAPRVTEPLAARLTDLGLAKQAELLRQIGARPEPVERLDDFVKLYQVLGLGVIRLSGACPVDRSRLVPVPGAPSVRVPHPAAHLSPAEVAQRRSRGTLGPWEAAVHRARHYAEIPTAELARILPHWAYGAAAPLVAQALAREPDAARQTAEKALTLEYGLTAALTALRVLAAAGGDGCRSVLRGAGQAARGRSLITGQYWDAAALRETLRESAADALEELQLREGGGRPGNGRRLFSGGRIAESVESLRISGRADARFHAIHELAQHGQRAAIPVLRQVWRGDPAEHVRAAAARALATLGDLDMVEPLVTAFAARGTDKDGAKAAAYALAILGDLRGATALAEAMLEGWNPTVIGEALPMSGRAGAWAILDLATREPALAKRQTALSVLRALPEDTLLAMLAERLTAVQVMPTHAEAAAALLRLAGAQERVQKELARRILATTAGGETKAEKALRRAAQGALDDPPAPR